MVLRRLFQRRRRAAPISNDGRGVLFAQSVVGRALGTFVGRGLEVRSGSVEVNQSVFEERESLFVNPGTSFRSGASKLTFSRTVIPGGSAVCVASYDDSFTALPPGC